MNKIDELTLLLKGNFRGPFTSVMNRLGDSFNQRLTPKKRENLLNAVSNHCNIDMSRIILDYITPKYYSRCEQLIARIFKNNTTILS